jgi:hypothetical protein
MTDQELLNCRRLPARLTLDQAALLLGIHPDGMDYLVEIGLIEPLGGFPRGVQRLFAAVYIEHLGKDVKWLAKATAKIRQFNQQRNIARKNYAKPKLKPTEVLVQSQRTSANPDAKLTDGLCRVSKRALRFETHATLREVALNFPAS